MTKEELKKAAKIRYNQFLKKNNLDPDDRQDCNHAKSDWLQRTYCYSEGARDTIKKIIPLISDPILTENLTKILNAHQRWLIINDIIDYEL